MANKAKTAERRSRLVELMRAGVNKVEASEVLKNEGYPASPATLRRDVSKHLAPKWDAMNNEAFREYQLNELWQLREQLSNPAIKPDRRIELALAILDRQIRLAGTEAASKSIVAHVRENTAVQYRFLEHSHGLSAEQIEEVFSFMDSLPRPKKMSIADLFPTQQPQLAEATVVEDEVEDVTPDEEV